MQMGREVMDPVEAQLAKNINAIREQHSSREWRLGIPVKWIATRDYDGGICECKKIQGGRFECATCGRAQTYHEGKCEECAAEIILCPDWEFWGRLGASRERALVRTYQAMFGDGK